MAKRWEYMSIDWEQVRESSRDRDHATYYVRRPGAEVEVRPGYDSAKPDAEVPRFLDLLQEFGAEGWELVSETVFDAATVYALGWKTVQSPVSMRWMMKRPLP